MRTHRQSTDLPSHARGALRHVGIVGELPKAYRQLPARLAERGVLTETYTTAESLRQAMEESSVACFVAGQTGAVRGHDFTAEFAAQSPTVPFIVTAETATADEIIRAFDEGARGYFLASADPERLLDSMHRIFVEQNELWQRENERRSRLAGLSEREREVLDLLVAGHSVKTIARDLGIRPSTAEKHRARILLKTGFDTVISLVSFFLSADHPALPTAQNLNRRVDPQHRGGECHLIRQPCEIGTAV